MLKPISRITSNTASNFEYGHRMRKGTPEASNLPNSNNFLFIFFINSMIGHISGDGTLNFLSSYKG